MRRHLAISAAAMLAASLPASLRAQSVATIPLMLGESVTFQVDDGGAFNVARGLAGPMSDFDRAALDLTLNTDPKLTSGSNALDIRVGRTRLPEPPPVEPDTIRVRLVAVGDRGGQPLLVLENGYDRGLIYRARITAHGRSEVTDVCLVLPRLRGSEYWPYVIDRIELSGFRLEPWNESRGSHCE